MSDLVILKELTAILTLDCVPYSFTSHGDGEWICEAFTAFDIEVKDRFTEKYVGKMVNGTFLHITHYPNKTLVIYTGDAVSTEEQMELIESFFSIYFDSLLEIGYETLDREPE